MEFSVNGEYNIKKKLATNFSPFFLFHCYCQVASIFTFITDFFVKLLIFKCLRSIETKKLHVRIVVPKLQGLISRVTVRERCSVGTLYCTHCPNFSTKSQIGLNYHISKKHSAPKLNVTLKCKLFIKSFPDFTL